MDKELIKAFLKDIIIKEGLTPNQSSKVMSKYDSIYKGMLKGDKKKLMKYTDPKFKRPNPDAMAMGRAINLVKKDSLDEIEKDRFAGEDPRAGSTIKGRGFDWEKNNSQEIVIYNGEEHEVMRRVDDELGKRIYIRPKEESAILGKKNLFWVKPEDLEESVNEAGFQKMSQSQFKLRTAIKDQEKQNRLAKDDSEFPAGDLHKILISKVLGRGELDPKYDKTYKALLKKFDLVESLNEARTDLEREYNQYDSFTLDGEVYMIKDIEEYPGNKVQITTEPSPTQDYLTGDSRKSKIFFSDKILKRGGEFHKKERKQRKQRQKSTTRRQYERILKGAMGDAAGMGDEEFTYDMATSMIHDPEISSYLDKEYPRLGRNGKIERLQSDLEMYLQESVNELMGYEGDEEYEDYKFIEPKKYIKTLLLDFDKIIKNPSLEQDKIKEFQNLTQVEYDYLKNIYDNIIPDLLEEYKLNSLKIRVFSILYDTLKYVYDFMTKYLKEPIMEKKLTKPEKDKKEDIIMSMKKKKGGKDKLTDKDYAIATSTAKKVAETKLTELIKSALKNPKKEIDEGDGINPDYGEEEREMDLARMGRGEREDAENISKKELEDIKSTQKDLEKLKFFESPTLKEGNFDELKKHQKMLDDAADFFRSKAEELDVDRTLIGNFTQGKVRLIQAIFKADYNRTGGKIDENALIEHILKKLRG